MNILIRALFAALADRFRGSDGQITIKGVTIKVARFIKLLALGFCIGWIIDKPDLLTAFLLGVGFTFGYGNPLGAAITGMSPRERKLRKPGSKFETWQIFEITRTNAYVALALRGFITGLPLAFFDFYSGLIVAICYTIAYPLSVKAALGENDPWAISEFLRSFIAGVLIWAILSLH